jgi:hypothetical protein
MGQEAGRAELGALQAELLHLVKHRLRVRHLAPSGDLAGAPGDGGAGDATSAGAHVLRCLDAGCAARLGRWVIHTLSSVFEALQAVASLRAL